MSNTKAVKAHYERMRSKGFRTYSFLIHEDDVESVRSYVNDLKTGRLKHMVISPRETIDTMNRLQLTDEEFAMIHHQARKASIGTHIAYLSGLTRGYQEGSNNEIVAERLKLIEELSKTSLKRHRAIAQACEQYPFKGERE